MLEELGSKPSISEERGLSQIKNEDLMVFSPGVSTGGFAEIRMAKQNKNRKIIATTIDKEGLVFAKDTISKTDLGDQIEIRDEDLRSGWNYPDNYFDFIYARLVLHYLSAQDLDKVLARFYKSLKPEGRIFVVVVGSLKKLDSDNSNSLYDPETKFTKVIYKNSEGLVVGNGFRYYHTPDTISEHLTRAGLHIDNITEYKEKLYKDFMRREMSSKESGLIEVVASK